MKANAIWQRKQRGGMRRVSPLEVLVVGRTAAGCLVVEYVSRLEAAQEALRFYAAEANWALIVVTDEDNGTYETAHAHDDEGRIARAVLAGTAERQEQEGAEDA